MGNKTSIDAGGLQLDEPADATKAKSSCSTFVTEESSDAASDDSLEALVEATKEETNEESSKPRRNLFSALFAPSEPHQQQQQQQSAPPPLSPIKVRLCHCETDEEHRTYISQFLERVQDLYGKDGLGEAGFEFRKLYCSKHGPDNGGLSTHAQTNDDKHDDSTTQEEKKCDDSKSAPHLNRSFYGDRLESSSANACEPCQECATRLYYIGTDTLITEENRKQYIADGAMYEQVTRLAQECAHEEMQRAGNLEWITVCDDPAHEQPVRALVHEDHHLVNKDRAEDTADDHPTLLIATGKGKVRAGIFSRQHLLTSGMESSTALPMIVEAKKRQMSVVIFDPNARGDRYGMTTFEKSFEVVLGHLDHTNTDNSQMPAAEEHGPSKRALYIVAHSASGSQLVRYMLDRSHGYLPYLRAIAFTDSTHNIQWTRKNEALQNLLGSKRCVYFRSASKNHDDLWHTRKAGEAVETDSFWKHRFGGIKTVWAGTEEHSLMNYFANGHIWEHFDEHLHKDAHYTNGKDSSKEVR